MTILLKLIMEIYKSGPFLKFLVLGVSFVILPARLSALPFRFPISLLFTEMKTPCTNVLKHPKFADVYPPSEDSFLFLDALEKDVDFIKALNPNVSLEVGTGSGIVSAFLRSLGLNPTFHICTDVSFAACLAATHVLKCNLPSPLVATFDCVRCSLATPLLDRLSSSVDIILFNPPYVPTSPEEHHSEGSNIKTTWSGGANGREVIDAFLVQTVHLLSRTGCIYLLLSDENLPTEVHNLCHELSGGRLRPETILRRRANNESLGVFRYSPLTTPNSV
ncbi:S-adenosyl-L-methionine-dependent methyltransferase [Paragonimus kellicotti]|nr:S-adenosyl-L-methionine-dependent methyltransferase [Paragonimus kellicotti]